MEKLWYAVMLYSDDNDWGYGSDDRDEALKMLEACREKYPESYIAVIDDGDGPICIDIIK